MRLHGEHLPSIYQAQSSIPSTANLKIIKFTYALNKNSLLLHRSSLYQVYGCIITCSKTHSAQACPMLQGLGGLHCQCSLLTAICIDKSSPSFPQLSGFTGSPWTVASPAGRLFSLQVACSALLQSWSVVCSWSLTVLYTCVRMHKWR